MDQPRKKVIFRADANSVIGHGHITRLLALAEIIKHSFECSFAIQQPTPAILDKIQQADISYQVLRLTDASNRADELSELAKLKLANVILVLDGYHFSSNYQKWTKELGATLVCIDDLGDRYFYADAVINHSGGIAQTTCQTEVYTQLYLGPAYALLRLPFLQQSEHQRSVDRIDTAFICFGGADPLNLTKVALEGCLLADQILHVHVVIGSSYQHETSLKELIDSTAEKEIKLHINLTAEKLIEAIRKSNLAITSASTISYEAACVGLGMLTGYYVDNQRKLASFLTDSGCATNLGNLTEINATQLANKIDSLNISDIQQQIKAQKKHFVDSTKNLQGIFKHLSKISELTCRLANSGDAQLYYEWANEPETRRNAIQTEQIDWATHSQWFKRKIEEPSTCMFLFFHQKQPLGQVRFENGGGYFLISFSIDKTFRGRGWSSAMMQLAIQQLVRVEPDRPKLLAYVRETNTASIRVFERNSFKLVGREQQYDVWLKKFIKE